MNKEILNFLKEYGSDEYSINRLIVSAFLLEKNITDIKNTKIQELLIKKNELEYNFLEDFIKIIKKVNKNFCFEELLELFEFVISPSDKLVNGAIYTPKNIREYITKQSFEALNRKSIHKIKITDIACGCGGFLIDASREIKKKTNKSYKNIFKENIFGIDVHKYSVERTEILLTLLAITENEDKKEFEFNIYVGDTLQYDWKEIKFDMILGNPPYVCSRNMDAKTKELMKNWTTCKTGHPDLYIPFFEIGFSLLAPNGILGFITVNTFMNSVNGRAIREYFTKEKVFLKIIDFQDEQIFKDRMTYTCLCFIEKINSDYIYYTTKKESELESIENIKFNKDSYEKLNFQKGWSLKNSKLINKIEAVGTAFGETYETKSGIATLKNHVYIFKPTRTDRIYYYMEDGTSIEKKICKDIINTNQLKKYDDLKAITEKIIFPYIHDKNDQVVLIDEEKIQKKFPKAYAYLLTKRSLLATRDKGKGKYPIWYAFGRTQSLEKKKNKLFFPHLVKEGFKVAFNSDENLYFYNGMAAYAEKEELFILEKLLPSSTFWKYIENSAKHYVSGYFGLGKNYLKNFGIYNFNEEDIKFILNTKNEEKLNTFFRKKYMV